MYSVYSLQLSFYFFDHRNRSLCQAIPNKNIGWVLTCWDRNDQLSAVEPVNPRGRHFDDLILLSHLELCLHLNDGVVQRVDELLGVLLRVNEEVVLDLSDWAIDVDVPDTAYSKQGVLKSLSLTMVTASAKRNSVST